MSVIGRASPFLVGGAFTFNLGTGLTTVDLRAAAISAGWNGSDAVIATLPAGNYLYGGSNYALYIGGSFPGGVKLINKGLIAGSGGTGGSGGWSSTGFGPTPGGGNNGSAGLNVAVACTVDNSAGTIYGSGGGGGGGGGCSDATFSPLYGGTGGNGADYWNAATGGGAGQTSGPTYSGAGGNGGGIGSPGGAGTDASGNYFSLGAGGGAGGSAVAGYSYITWAGTGTNSGPNTG